MTEVLNGASGVIISLIFSYVPKVQNWYAVLDSKNKRLVMLGMLFVVTVGIYALACLGVADRFGLQVTCDQDGLVALVQAFLTALIANQATYLISPKPEPLILPEPEYEDIAKPF